MEPEQPQPIAINIPEQPDPEPEHEEQKPRAVQNLERDVGGLTAGYDQLEADLHSHWAVMLVLAFALGSLAAIVFLQGRKLKELSGVLG